MKAFFGILSLIFLSSAPVLGMASTYYGFAVLNSSPSGICGRSTSTLNAEEVQWGTVSPSSFIQGTNSSSPNGWSALEQLYANCQPGQTWDKPQTPTITFKFSNDYCASYINDDTCTIETVVNCQNGNVTFTPGSYSCTGSANVSLGKNGTEDQYTIK
jgi:hypothetical protein